MAWTTPLTAVANATLTAAQWNATVRDDLLEGAPAKATVAGRFFATTGANSIAERIPSATQISGADTTSATSYGALSGSSGPVVTVTTGPVALVAVGALTQNSTASSNSFASYAISGATTVAANDTISIGASNPTAAATNNNASRVKLETALTPGSNTFTMQYRVASGTGTFSNRHLAVIPF